MYRIGIVGASSLAGKELSDELADSLLGASEFVFLDDDDAAGLMTAAGDEAVFIRRIESGSFERLDFIFFAGDAQTTKKNWDQAKRSGASIIDLTGSLEQEPGALVRAPWVAEALGGNERALRGPDLQTPAVISAHPAAMMLALAAARLKAKLSLISVAATVMEPASEHGKHAMDELHQQTVNLLSFQSLPREQYDAQVAFNALPMLGESAKVDLGGVRRQIARHFAELSGGLLPELALQVVQVPVFHGYVASMLVEFAEMTSAEQVEIALSGEHMDVVTSESEPPSNLSAVGQEDVMVRVNSASEEGGEGKRFWLWLAADNLKLGAVNAIACGLEMRKLRPSGKVQ
jgi:aspartate-semialdehyde dehydrogenase